MKATILYGPRDIRFDAVAIPAIELPTDAVIRPFNCGLLSITFKRHDGSARDVGAGQGCGDGASAADRYCAGPASDRPGWLMSSLGSWSFPRSRSAS
jgi:hypothetical protein